MMNDPLFSSTLLLCLSATFAATALLCRYAGPVCERLGLIDKPDERKLHRQATPLVGGLALVCIVLPLATLASWIPANHINPPLLAMALVSAALALVGLVDDRVTLQPAVRVLLGFALFGGLAWLEPSFLVRSLKFPLLGFQIGLGFDALAAFFTALCLVGLVNAVNMADGKNGLVIGLSVGWLAIIALRAPAGDVPFIGIMLAGLIALLVMNLRGRLFLGDGGAYGLAAAVGLLTIRSYNHFVGSTDLAMKAPSPVGLTAEEVVLLFLVPVSDSIRLTYVRLRRGQSPMAADRDHLHHKLQEWLGWPGGLYAYLIASLAPAVAVLWVRS